MWFQQIPSPELLLLLSGWEPQKYDVLGNKGTFFPHQKSWILFFETSSFDDKKILSTKKKKVFFLEHISKVTSKKCQSTIPPSPFSLEKKGLKVNSPFCLLHFLCGEKFKRAWMHFSFTIKVSKQKYLNFDVKKKRKKGKKVHLFLLVWDYSSRKCFTFFRLQFNHRPV